MQIDQLLGQIGGLAGLGILTAGIGFAYSQYKSGSNKAKDELIATLKDTAEAQKAKAARLELEKATLINSHQAQINELNNQIGKLQGLYEAAEKRNKELSDILQGVSPEEKQYREDMRKFTKGVAQYMENSAKVMDTIMKRLDEKEKEAKS